MLFHFHICFLYFFNLLNKWVIWIIWGYSFGFRDASRIPSSTTLLLSPNVFAKFYAKEWQNAAKQIITKIRGSRKFRAVSCWRRNVVENIARFWGGGRFNVIRKGPHKIYLTPPKFYRFSYMKIISDFISFLFSFFIT